MRIALTIVLTVVTTWGHAAEVMFSEKYPYSDADLEFFKKQIEAEPDLVTRADGAGQTLLHVAASSKLQPVKLIQYLIDEGAKIEATTNWGYTPLELCGQREESQRVLIENGAKKTLAASIVIGEIEVVREFIKANPKRIDGMAVKDDWPRARGPTLLAWAAINKQHEIMKLLLDSGASVRPTEYGGRSNPLSISTNLVDESAVKILLDKNGRRRRFDKWIMAESIENTVRRKNVKIMKLLLPDKLTAVDRELFGEGLVLSARLNQPEMVKELVENGIDVNQSGENGYTAAHIASFFGNTQMVQLLVDLGADINAVDKNGLTPLDFAADRPPVRLGSRPGLPGHVTRERLKSMGAKPGKQD